MILYIGEKVVLADEGEDGRFSEFEEVRKCFARLTVEEVSKESSRVSSLNGAVQGDMSRTDRLYFA